MTTPLNIAFLGNFGPMCTEWQTREGFQMLGHTVTAFQENDLSKWDTLIDCVDAFDLILWTRTRSYAELAGDERQMRLGIRATRNRVPLVGIHADLWWGLRRQYELTDDVYFEVLDVFFSADGAHDKDFAELNIPHRWLLPAIAQSHIGKGKGRLEYQSRIAFVGSWDGSYHKEAPRHRLIAWLDSTFQNNVKFWPKPGQPRIWGSDLSDLYASVQLAVGDSANIKGAGYYCSDRVPNTLGRGCMLAHPHVEGVTGEGDPFFHQALITWAPGNWDEAQRVIEGAMDLPQTFVDDLTDDAIQFIRQNHTWTVRAQQVLDNLEEMGVL